MGSAPGTTPRDDFFDGLCVGVALGMAAVLALFAIMAAAGVYGG